MEKLQAFGPYSDPCEHCLERRSNPLVCITLVVIGIAIGMVIKSVWQHLERPALTPLPSHISYSDEGDYLSRVIAGGKP